MDVGWASPDPACLKKTSKYPQYPTNIPALPQIWKIFQQNVYCPSHHSVQSCKWNFLLKHFYSLTLTINNAVFTVIIGHIMYVGYLAWKLWIIILHN